MLVNMSAHLAVITFFLLLDSTTEAAPTSFKLCGRKLVEAMEIVCKEYNSPPWDVPTVIEQPTGIVRRKRQAGIADRCCISTCRTTELLQYCSVIKLETPLELMDDHSIEDRSVETASSVSSPAVIAKEDSSGARREKLVKNAARAAPVVGTVSPLLTWGRTLNTDLPSAERDRYAYVAVYS